MFWIDADCYSMTPLEARDKFAKEIWWVDADRWISMMILTQDLEGLTAMREEYTKKTGKDWKTASLNSVKETLGFCQELYQQGKVMYSGSPNFKAIMINEGVDVSTGLAKSVLKKIEGV
jgi:hypothetical protein